MSTGWNIVVSAMAAVLAGLALAAAGVAQQRAASSRPKEERFSLRLVGELVRNRTWLAGIGAAGLSYGFQAVALSLGPLVLVQPLIVSELLFAIPLSLRRHDLHLRQRDWLAVLAVITGLAVGIVSADPARGDPMQTFSRWLPVLVAVAILASVSLLVSRWLKGPPTASAVAFAGALVMGLQSALYASALALLGHRGWGAFAHWEPYALVVVSVLGAYLIQNAFQAGPLAAGSPVIDATLPLVAIFLGIALFGERVRTTVPGLVGEAVGLVLMVAGIVALNTSRLVRHEHRLEEREQRQVGEQPA